MNISRIGFEAFCLIFGSGFFYGGITAIREGLPKRGKDRAGPMIEGVVMVLIGVCLVALFAVHMGGAE